MLSNLLSILVFRTVSATVLVCGLTTSIAQSAPLEVFIATDYVINAETGLNVPAALNPSGSADLTYIKNGIVLGFIGKDGKSHNIKVHLDFESLLNVDPNNRAVATAIYDKIKQAGPSAIGTILEEIAIRAKASGQVLFVMIDADRSAVFFKTDYDLGQVRVVTSGGENVRLQNLVASTFFPSQPVLAPEKKNNQRESVQNPANPQIPDVELNHENSAVRAIRSCEIQFVSNVSF